jgi:light-regulated signal transduction histidine kinase (bacteriophytochrome)
VEILVASARRMTIDFKLAPIRDEQGCITHLLASAVDISDRKLAELALLRKTEELSLVNRELESFSYSVSHDLRQPLRAINGFSGALREEHGHLLPPEAHHYLDRVHGATLRMGELIDGLLNLSQVIRSELRLTDVDLSRMANHIADGLREGEPQRSLAFHIQPALVTVGDPALMQTLLENLFANAWKFTGRRARGRIEFGRAPVPEEPVYFVRDNGVGFDMNAAHRLFQPFERLHGPGEFAGTGIGLATVRRIVERHGGRVWAESGVDRGTTIYFCLAGHPCRGGADYP